jgi:hypothetical protein
VGHRFPILRNEKDDRRLASQITEATLRSWKVVCEPHIKGISGNVPNIDPVLFLNQMKDEGSTMIMIPWKSVLKYLNCLKLTKDKKKLNFEDFVEKNTGIQTYVYKIRNFSLQNRSYVRLSTDSKHSRILLRK